MKQFALFYNFDEERFRKIKFSLAPLKISAVAVRKSDYNQPIGYLAGIKNVEPNNSRIFLEDFQDEMIVMHNFTNYSVEQLIKALVKCGIGRVALKAVITPTNKDWNSVQLYKAIKADHMEMNGLTSC